MPTYNPTLPWNQGVRGEQVLPLINDDAPVLRVEAGPGTGKTFGLARRVQRIVHPRGLGVPPDDVLVVAFNRVIASDLRREICSRLAEGGITSQPEIQTIHGLCRKLLQDDGSRLLLPHERDAMVFDVLHAHPRLREEFKTAPQTHQALRDHEAGHATHVALSQACRRWLAQHAARLVGDLPGEVRDRLLGGDFEDKRYRHVIVDEFQDLSPAEQHLVTLLRTPDGQLLALGDPRQSIYAFRGNDRMGLRRLESLTGQAVVDLPMSECQRCPEQVVAAANALTTLDDAVALEAVSDRSANIHVVHWKTPVDEARGMAAAILANLDARPSDRHLVMVSRRQFGYRLRDELRRLRSDVDVDLSFSESILELWPVREAFLFFCLLADPDPGTWRAWLGYCNTPPATDFKAPERNADAYSRLLERSGGTITDAEMRVLATEPMNARRGSGGRALWGRSARYVQLMSSVSWSDLPAHELINLAFDPARWPSESDEEATAAQDLAALASRAREIMAEQADCDCPANREKVLREVARDLRYVIATREPLARAEAAQLQVATFWGAKGLTADHVYVLGLCQEALPGKRTAEYPGTEEEYLEEQRRLLYVTITRSKETLVLSRPTKVKWGDASQLKLPVSQRTDKYHAQLLMSPFLRDILRHVPASVPGDVWAGCA
jgi:superfamily I DNA/RNA helicase